MSTGIRGNSATSTSTSSTSASGPSLLWTPVDSEDESLRGFVRSFDEVTAIIKSFEVASSFTYVKEYDRCHGHDDHDDPATAPAPARPSGGRGPTATTTTTTTSASVSTAKQQKVRFQDIRDSVIPEDGVPFLTERTISYACMFGRDKNAARKKRGEEERAKEISGDHPTKKHYKKIMVSKKKGCTAFIHVKQVTRFIDYKDCNSKWSKRKASEEIRLARLRGETLSSDRRFYIRLPSHEDHQKTHSVGEVSFVMEACTPEPVQAVVGEKRDFGSFHSSNVQELVEAAEDSYLPPSFPFEVPAFTDCKDLTFGEEARRKHFLLEECTFLNHGAFGATLKDALDVAQRWQRYIERQPLRFFDREVLPHMAYITRRLAKFVGSEASGIVLVPNVTTAINAVVRSIPFKKGEKIFCLNITYGAVKKLLKHTAESLQLEYQEENLNLPLTSKQEILDLVSSILSSNTRLAVFDHIPSNATFIMPVKEIIDICHGRGVPVLIDGAHALGALPLSMKDLNPDYYTANAHKWLCNPKGCAFLYVREELRSRTRPLVVSHGFGSGFNSEFIWSGLRDYSPFLALHTVLDFWNAVGVNRIRQGMHGLLSQAVDLLVKAWETGLLAPISMCGSMALVELPHELSRNHTVEYSLAESVQNELYHRYNIEVPIKALQDRLYVRISAHIYNELPEYQRLASAVLEIAKSKGGQQARDAIARKLDDAR